AFVFPLLCPRVRILPKRRVRQRLCHVYTCMTCLSFVDEVRSVWLSLVVFVTSPIKQTLWRVSEVFAVINLPTFYRDTTALDQNGRVRANCLGPWAGRKLINRCEPPSSQPDDGRYPDRGKLGVDTCFLAEQTPIHRHVMVWATLPLGGCPATPSLCKYRFGLG